MVEISWFVLNNDASRALFYIFFHLITYDYLTNAFHTWFRSGSKVMDRGRVSPASEAVLPLSIEQQQQDHFDANDDR